MRHFFPFTTDGGVLPDPGLDLRCMARGGQKSDELVMSQGLGAPDLSRRSSGLAKGWRGSPRDVFSEWNLRGGIVKRIIRLRPLRRR
ncbi:MAG: hypothetical protein M2R45_05111 [Verrucomicrobia subdivision 3 bacterium]|nr:hypothetical protein [Limisphaerales bacterium]MCS1417756.1 hypothetical protein [Limisphaerales bacterium]